MRFCWLWIGMALLGLGCGSGVEVLADFDGDGSLDANDCDAADSSIHPGAPDAYGDGVDSNCDGTDGTDSDADGYPGDTTAPAAERDWPLTDAERAEVRRVEPETEEPPPSASSSSSSSGTSS